MTAQQYEHTQRTLTECAGKISLLNIEGFLMEIHKAETLCPMIDPTMYEKAEANLAALRKLAQAAVPMQRAHEGLVQAIVDTHVKGHYEPRN